MADQLLNLSGLNYLLSKLGSFFVRKDGNKVLSDNNFTDAEKQKLSQLDALPIATREIVGGVRVGNGLSVSSSGTLSLEKEMSWDNLSNKPITLSGYGITDALSKPEFAEHEYLANLIAENIPNTIQTVVYDSKGVVVRIVHTRNGSPFRTDSFNFTQEKATPSVIVETRVLQTGQRLVITTTIGSNSSGQETISTETTYTGV